MACHHRILTIRGQHLQFAVNLLKNILGLLLCLKKGSILVKFVRRGLYKEFLLKNKFLVDSCVHLFTRNKG